MSITAVVLTLNEETHLPECLSYLRELTNSILVLDSGSTDRTQEIARDAGALVEKRAFDGYASQRNAALDLVGSAGWVFFVDADERIPAALVDEIRVRTAAAPDDVAGFWLPRRNMFFGRQVTGGGWWPDYQARLFRTGRARFDDMRQVHEVAILDGRSERLREPLIHINYESRREFVQKQRAYTRQRVALSKDGGQPRRRSYVAAPVRELRRRLITQQGYRDGVTGVFLATVLAIEEVRACWLMRRRQ